MPTHLSGGNESDLIWIFKNIKPSDWVVSTHRNHYHYLLKGGDADALFQEITGGVNSLCGGKSGSMHTTDMGRRFISSCLVGCGAPIAVGIAESLKRACSKDSVWCFVGDGAVDQGMFYEALVYAESKDLPITFVVEDNNRSVASTKEDRGVENSPTRQGAILLSNKVKYYSFEPTYPHCGDGSFISF